MIPTLHLASAGRALSDADDLSTVAMTGRYECWREAVVADGTAQGQVTDWSGNANHATSTGTARPLYKTSIINSLPAWRYDGSNDYSQTASIPAMNNVATRWFYLVAEFINTDPAIGAAFGAENSGAPEIGELVYRISGGPSLVLRYSTNASAPTGFNYSQVLARAGFRVHKIVLDGTNVTRKVTGTTVNTQSQPTAPPNGTFQLILGALAAGSPPSTFGNVDIAAFFMGNTLLTSEIQARIESYILSVYGLAT